MTQWVLRITAYADRLVEELDGLDWPAGTDKMQRDWIGKSIGANATFTVVGTGEAISVFTTRPDTLFGGTYVVLAPEHPLVARITTSAQRAAVTAYCDGVATRSERERAIRYRLRDWLFSRQRYWGEPFPTIELGDGTVKLWPKDQLPVVLPEIDEYRPTRDGQPPLARARQWLQTQHPQTGQPARRETNTMPQWAGSCWYYLRFLSPTRDDVGWDPAEEKYWMPVDLYVGGSEHATLHLLYARFWHKVLYDAGRVSTKEPFQRLVHQGMIHKRSFRDVRGQYN